MVGIFSFFHERLDHFIDDRDARAWRSAYLNKVTEQVVDGINPRLRVVGGYARKLRPAVETMTEYASAVCSRLPGPLVCSRQAWGTDPTTRTLFATADDLQRVFSRSDVVSEMFRHIVDPLPEFAYAVLGMRRTDKTVFGMEQDGEIIKKDVIQHTVSFGDYRVNQCADSDRILRDELRERALNEMIRQALRSILAMEERRDGLRERKLQLSMQLKILDQQGGGLSDVLTGRDQENGPGAAEIRAELDKLEQQCSQVKEVLGTLDAQMDAARNLLSNPEGLVSVDRECLIVDQMNRVYAEDHAEKGQKVELGRIQFADGETRYGVLAVFPRTDFLPEEDFLARSSRLFS